MSGASSKDPVQVRGGLKAAINNPKVPRETKERVQERLDQGEGLDAAPIQVLGQPSSEELNKEDLDGPLNGNERGGYKATLANPNVSSEAKERARAKLEADEAECQPSDEDIY